MNLNLTQSALCTLGLLFLLHFTPLHAQGLQIGVFGGGALYSGDLSPQEFDLYFGEINPAGGVFARLNVTERFGFRLGISAMKLSGRDTEETGRAERGLNFRSRLTEFALTAELSLFRLGYADGFNVMPFVYGGGAVYKFNPEAEFDGQFIELQPLGTEGQGLPGYEAPYNLTQLAIPFGGGLKFNFGGGFTLGLEMGGRKLFTDHLDDVSSATINYLDVLEGNGRIAATLSNPTIDPSDGDIDFRRGGEFNDWYFTGGVTLAFRLAGGGNGYGRRRGKEMGCPVW